MPNDYGRGIGNYNQKRKDYSCLHRWKFGHKTVDHTYRTQKNVVESLYQNTNKSYENPQSLFLASNTCFIRRNCLIFGY